jgi:hypothetical protein
VTNEYNTPHSSGIHTTDNGLSLPGSRGEPDIAISQGSYEGFREIRGGPSNTTDRSQPWTARQRQNHRSAAGASHQHPNLSSPAGHIGDRQDQYPQIPPIPTNIPDTASHRQCHGKKTKATIKVASFNMRGREMEKWYHLNQLMRDNKIGILALQKAHLTEQHTDHLYNLFHKRIKIFYSSDPNTPNAKGVAIVLNKELTTTREAVVHEVIQ